MRCRGRWSGVFPGCCKPTFKQAADSPRRNAQPGKLPRIDRAIYRLRLPLPGPRRQSRSGASPMTRHLIALLGRKDVPTDTVEEYCRYLGDALQAHGFQMQIRHVPSELHGWSQSLRALQLQSPAWRDTWVLVQYTALAWSARGFPLKFPRVLR